MKSLTLEEITKKAKKHTVTPLERRAQRVSLVTGLLSKKTTLTKERVESILDQIEGHR